MSDIVKDLRQAIDNLTFMPNAVSAWEDAHGGNRALATRNAEKVRQAEALLAEVLASMPTGTRYEVFGFTHGGPARFETEAELLASMEKIGITRSGTSGAPLRTELRGQPKFKGLAGPMFGGAGVVRYDSPAVHATLSR
jgi:hypothetical protein